MKIAIIGRAEILYETVILLQNSGYKIVCILTAKRHQSTHVKQRILRSWLNLNIPFAQGGRIDKLEKFLRSSNADSGQHELCKRYTTKNNKYISIWNFKRSWWRLAKVQRQCLPGLGHS